MQKTYEGWSSFNPNRLRFIVEWLCPHCKSPKVTMEENDYFRNARWIDGDATTRDNYGKWTCNAGGKVKRGHQMIKLPILTERIITAEESKKPIIDRIMNPSKETE